MSGEKRMQAAEMQIKTENSVEAASAVLRTLRHAVPVLLALLIALLAAAPVLADETDEAITDTETVSAEPTEDLRDDYTAVAAQLEAVARAEGRDMADKMLSTALHSLTGTSVDTPMTPKAPFPPRLRPRPQSRRLSSSTPPCRRAPSGLQRAFCRFWPLCCWHF